MLIVLVNARKSWEMLEMVVRHSLNVLHIEISIGGKINGD